MAYADPVPALIAGLVGLFAGLPQLAGVEVIDGPSLPDSSARTAVFVGWSGWAADVSGLDPTAAESVVSLEGLGGSRDRITHVVHCTVQVLNGDNDIVAARTAACGYRAACRGAIATHRVLPGVQGVLRGGGQALRQEQSNNGALATATFDVEADTYTPA